MGNGFYLPSPANAAGKPVNPLAGHHFAPVPTPGSGSGIKDWNPILDELPYGLAVFSPEQQLLHENGSFRDLLGYGIQEKGGIESWLRALSTDTAHAGKLIVSWREYLWRNQLTQVFSLKSANQKIREIEFRSSLLPDGGITLTIQDVTEKHRTQENLHQGKLKFRALFSHAETGIVLVDRTGRIIEANPAFLVLTGHALSELRLNTLAGLLHPRDAEALAKAEAALCEAPIAEIGADQSISREIWLRSKKSEIKTRITYCPIGDETSPQSMGIYLFEKPGTSNEVNEQLAAKLQALAVKAQALIASVPDLILLINPDLSISDYAPPPKPWDEISPDKSWRNKLISDVWPALGNLVKESVPRVLQNGENISAEIRGEDAELFSFEVNLAACGNNQILAVVRNHSDLRRLKEGTGWLDEVFTKSRDAILICDGTGCIQQANHSGAALVGVSREELVGKRLGSLYRSGKDEGDGFQQRVAMGLSLNNTWKCEEPLVTSEGIAISCSSEFQLIKNGPKENLLMLTIREGTGAPQEPLMWQPSRETDGILSRESTQHSFRNQLQLVTSLFNLEPQGAAARDAFIKWQIRLRAMAQALPYGGGSNVWVVPLIRQVADEVCSLTGQGPGRREVIVTGLETISLPAQTAAPFSLLMGELIRLIVCEGPRGPGPELYLNLHETDGSLRLVVRPGTNRRFAFIDRESEIETLEILTEQIQGHLSVPDDVDPSEEWELVVPLRPN